MCDNIGNYRTSPKTKGIIGNIRPLAGLRLHFVECVIVTCLAKRQVYFLFVALYVLIAPHVLSNMLHYHCRKHNQNNQLQLRTPQLLSPTRLLQSILIKQKDKENL